MSGRASVDTRRLIEPERFFLVRKTPKFIPASARQFRRLPAIAGRR